MKSITLILVLMLAMIGFGEAETVVAGPYTIDVNPGFPGFTTTIQGPIDGQIANSPEFTSYIVIFSGNITDNSSILSLPTVRIFIDRFHIPVVDPGDTTSVDETLRQSIDWSLSKEFTSAAAYAKRPFDGSMGMMGKNKENSIFIAIWFKDGNTKITLETLGLDQDTFYLISNSFHIGGERLSRRQ